MRTDATAGANLDRAAGGSAESSDERERLQQELEALARAELARAAGALVEGDRHLGDLEPLSDRRGRSSANGRGFRSAPTRTSRSSAL